MNTEKYKSILLRIVARTNRALIPDLIANRSQSVQFSGRFDIFIVRFRWKVFNDLILCHMKLRKEWI